MLPESIASLIDGGRPFILDGGLGSELEARGFDISTPLWSAELILKRPEALLDVHRAYLEAGAQCITTASYQASIAGLAAAGIDPAGMEAVFRSLVEIACRARDEFLRDHPGREFRPLVAASVGPYGAYLADGSEYRGNYGVDDSLLRDFHRQRMRWLDRSPADLIACETIPDLREVAVLRELLESVSTPAWVSFCCADEKRLQDGSPIEDAAGLFDDCKAVFALGVNCCAPRFLEPLIERIRAVDKARLIVVYPNSGQQYDAEAKLWRGEAGLRYWSEQALRWFAAGAGMIGGCCRIGPDYIRQLASEKSWHC